MDTWGYDDLACAGFIIQSMNIQQTPLPNFFDPQKLNTHWRVDYAARASEAREWSRLHGLHPAAKDSKKIWLLLIDVQNTFCLPDFELFVGGRDGRGAVDDNRRLCEFIYRNLGHISRITATLDTHRAMQIFHPIFLVDSAGEHPAPFSLVTRADLEAGRWKFNPALADEFNISAEYGHERLVHYASALEKNGKLALTIWPYHAMLGGVGHALVSCVEEALFFHSIARLAPTQFELKGDRPFTENYSAIGPEVTVGPRGEVLGEHNSKFIETLKEVDVLIIAGQAKSHCVAWTVADLLNDITAADSSLAQKIYLLEDCTSPVVVPGLDYTDAADEAFAKFAQAGMHRVKSTDDFWAQI